VTWYLGKGEVSMKNVILELASKLGSLDARQLELETFDLLLAGCSACCSQYTGGNETCPPKKEAAIG
jgi:hypothetical protein